MKIITLILICCLFTLQAQARRFNDVLFEEQIRIEDVSQPLQLNGIGVRYKFFFKIYIAALYSERVSHDPAVLFDSKLAKRIRMHFIYDEVDKNKLVEGWMDGFQSNLNEKDYQSLESRIIQFNAMFETVNKNDQVLLDYIPGQGTRVSIRNNIKGLIKGADFYQALLKIWLGESPVTDDLKNALLGIEDDY